MRNDAYEKLVEKCRDICPEADIKYVRKKIDSLRAGFRRELREMRKTSRTGSATDSIYQPTLWYFKLLLFTKDQEEIRVGTSSTASLESDIEEDDTQGERIVSINIYIAHLFCWFSTGTARNEKDLKDWKCYG
ncbi:Alcohol dehydrogenase transcription factor Myb/SANT-like [Popillia japonica]|uniref:Alcohol dehydrogenase transcription factor Myb/SANT-like n=1 Tax=Popillia japonica TaxID=7064 RepID=A0AAW1MIZ2_POPJA